MPDPANLTPRAVRIPGAELREAVVNEDATSADQMVKCVVGERTTDLCPWMPYVTGDGVFYPKRGDRALVSAQPDGPEVVLWWQPSAAEPDVSF